MCKLEILKNGGIEIYLHYLKAREVKQTNNGYITRSPFREDRNPSFQVYRPEEGDRYFYKDYGDESIKGDVFNFIAEIEGLCVKTEFEQILKIGKEKLDNSKPPNLQEQPFYKMRKNNKALGYKLEKCNFSEQGLNYWKDYKVEGEFLLNNGVQELKSYETITEKGNSWITEMDNLSFVFSSGQGNKRYTPKPKKFNILKNNNDSYSFTVEGEQYPLNDDIDKVSVIVLVGGEKDAITFTRHTGITSMCLTSETKVPCRSLLKWYFESNTRLFSLYDCDKVGIESMERLSEKGITPIYLSEHIPKELQYVKGKENTVKDVSDYVKLGLSTEELKKFCVQKIEEVINKESTMKSKEEYKGMPRWRYGGLELLEESNETNIVGEIKPEKLLNVGDLSRFPELIQTFVKSGCEGFERDVLLLSILCTSSALMDKVSFFYGKQYYANLLISISSSSGNGKSVILKSEKVIKSILKEKAKDNKTKFLLPANSSTAAIGKQLELNGGTGLIIESEMDNLVPKSDGDFNDNSKFYRCVGEHEAISSLRVEKSSEYYVETPKLSGIVTGTKDQTNGFFKSAENGLFSRFVHYNLSIPPGWRNMFESNMYDKEELEKQDESFLQLYNLMNSINELSIKFNKEQQNVISETFKRLYFDANNKYSGKADSLVKRAPVTVLRIATILEILGRFETRSLDNEEVIFCSENNFKLALEIGKKLLVHSFQVYEGLPKTDTKRNPPYMKLLPHFIKGKVLNKQEIMKIAKGIGIAPSTAEKHLRKLVSSGLLNKQAHGMYCL